jgi:hypothetical protein
MEGSGGIAPANGVHLYWIPLGAGEPSPLIRWSGACFEAYQARRERRPPLDLYHAALQVWLDGGRYVIEMAPAWGPGHGQPGVVATGPVGLRALGRSRFFRYEVRRWRDGVIPDLGYAVGGPRRVADDARTSGRVLGLAADFPTGTWGRDEFGAGDMWNSNSLVAWLLARSGVDAHRLAPPANGRAPGWRAGLAVAARDLGRPPE